MSRTFQFTVPDDIGQEIEQHIFAKYGVIPSKALPNLVLGAMAKNPLTAAQIARIVRRYQDRAIVVPTAIAAALKEE